MPIYIIAVVIALVLITILFFALRSTVKRIDYNTKKYFVEKLQDYDYLIEEKQQVLDNLNKEIEENKKALSELKANNLTKEPPKESKYYNNTSVPRYTDEELFKKYKDIKEKFSFDFYEVVKSFVKEKLTKDTGEYDILVKIRKKFSNDVIYKIMGFKSIEQKKQVEDMLDSVEMNTIKKHIKMNEFNINKFITVLDTAIEKTDPVVYVYTGDKNSNYDSISNIVKTVYDVNVNEGIKILYKGNLYDYSL